MRLVVRSTGVTLLATVAAVQLALTSMATPPLYSLAAATYIVSGQGYPATDQANIDLATPYITDETAAPPPPPLIVVYYPGPLPSPDSIQSGTVIFGYSEGAGVATTFKQNFNQYWASNAGVPPAIEFVLIGNLDRPNGGTNERANEGATPTQTQGAAPGQITTYDIAFQYDGVADNPTNTLNLLADANADIGSALVHSDYGSVNMSQAQLQGTYGDTAYYLIPTYPLPLLMPLDLIPGVGPILADMWDPPLRVLVEAGYDRTINPGVPTPANLAYFPNPTTLTNNYQLATTTGLDNALSDLGMGRPYGTVRPGPYGVGGPPVLVATPSSQQPGTTTPSTLTPQLTSFSQPVSPVSTPTSTPAPSSATMLPSAAAQAGPQSAGPAPNASALTKAMPIAAPAKNVESRPPTLDTRPTIPAPNGSELPGVKHPASSPQALPLTRVLGGPSATGDSSSAARRGAGQGAANGGKGGGP